MSSEKGFVLLSVLVILAVLTPLVVNFSYSARVQMAGADYFSSKVKSREIARAGLESAIAVLKKDDAAYDSPLEEWGRFGELSRLSAGFFDEGYFVGTIEDEEGKININYLVSDVQVQIKGQVTRLFEILGFDTGVLDAINDWIDPDSETEMMGGEDYYYSSFENPYNSKDGKMDVVHELKLVRDAAKLFNIDKEEPGLLEFITVYGDSLININTAPFEAIASLSDDIDSASVDDIISFRKNEAFKNNADLLKVIGEETFQVIEKKVKFQSDYFAIKVRGVVREVYADLQAVVKREKGKIRIIYYSEA